MPHIVTIHMANEMIESSSFGANLHIEKIIISLIWVGQTFGMVLKADLETLIWRLKSH